MVMVGIVPSRHSYKLVKESGCFVVNLVTPPMKAAFDCLGSHSGLDGDKIAATGLAIADGLKVAASILTDCPVNIECTVVDSIRTGSHEMFVGKIEYVHADASLVDAEGKIDWGRVEFLRL
jgi:flavin reductase (DIM6/NTAB) family NADH-FMN oxidoreductase RutF